MDDATDLAEKLYDMTQKDMSDFIASFNASHGTSLVCDIDGIPSLIDEIMAVI